jgi:hypothetical protein
VWGAWHKAVLSHAGLQTDAMKIEIEVTAKRRKGD